MDEIARTMIIWQGTHVCICGRSPRSFFQLPLLAVVSYLLILEAKNNSPQNKYIQSIKFIKKIYEKSWFAHAAITQGGSIEFEMGSQPNERFGFDKNTVPPSMSDIFSANTAKR
jgi:putative alpha-1,2-mannosidase